MPGQVDPRDYTHCWRVQLDPRNHGPLLLRLPIGDQPPPPAGKLQLAMQLIAAALQLPTHRVTQYHDLPTGSCVLIVHSPSVETTNGLGAVEIQKVSLLKATK